MDTTTALEAIDMSDAETIKTGEVDDTWKEITQQRPTDIDDAVSCMHKTLRYFHARNDYRAIFLRTYYIMTLEVHAAVRKLGDYKTGIFLDPDWVSSLSGKFASLYFQSLTTFERAPAPETEKAWKRAHEMAKNKTSAVLQDALLGMNAHINYDLAYALFQNFREHADDRRLQMRKFDHDQVNNLLVRCIDPIEDVLARDYGEPTFLADRLVGRLDENLTESGLKYYRERVWSDALAFFATDTEQQVDLVRQKLNWESYKLAQLLSGETLLQRAVWLPGRLLRKNQFVGIELEGEGGINARPRGGTAGVNPHR